MNEHDGEGSSAADRFTRLRPFLDQLPAILGTSSALSVTVTAVEHSFALNPWEHESCRRGLSDGEPAWCRLMAEAIAVEMAISAAAAQEGPAEDLIGFRTDILAEIKAASRTLLERGAFNESTRLSRFRLKLPGMAVTPTPRLEAPEPDAEASPGPPIVTAGEVPDSGRPETVPGKTPPRRTPRPTHGGTKSTVAKAPAPVATMPQTEVDPRVARMRARRAALARLRRRHLRTLLILTPILVLCWTGALLFETMGPPEPRAFTMDDFRHLPGIAQVEAYPPSLYITVSDQSWMALDDAGRRDVVEAVARLIQPEGYSGVVFRRADGVIVAEWLVEGGTSLADPARPAS